jgi:hypothetical protein
VAFAERMPPEGRAPGCLDPHELFALDELAPRLAQGGIRVVPQPTERT